MPPSPPISPEKRRERYLEAVRDKMVKLYAYGEAKPPAREQLWHEITGFLEAGKVLSKTKSCFLAVSANLIEPLNPSNFQFLASYVKHHCLTRHSLKNRQ